MANKISRQRFMEVKNFFQRKSIYRQLKSLALGFVSGKNKDIKLVFNDNGENYTDGKTVVVSLFHFAYDCSFAEIFSILKACVAHEVAHVLYSNFKYIKQIRDEVSLYLYTRHNIPKRIGEQIAAHLHNSLEDGRIERIHATRYKGILKHFKFLRNIWWENNGVDENTLPHQLWSASILTLATTGMWPKGYVVEGNEEVTELVKSLIPNIHNAVYANDPLTLNKETFEIIKKSEEFLAKCFENELSDEEQQALNDFLSEMASSMQNQSQEMNDAQMNRIKEELDELNEDEMELPHNTSTISKPSSQQQSSQGQDGSEDNSNNQEENSDENSGNDNQKSSEQQDVSEGDNQDDSNEENGSNGDNEDTDTNDSGMSKDSKEQEASSDSKNKKQDDNSSNSSSNGKSDDSKQEDEAGDTNGDSDSNENKEDQDGDNKSSKSSNQDDKDSDNQDSDNQDGDKSDSQGDNQKDADSNEQSDNNSSNKTKSDELREEIEKAMQEHESKAKDFLKEAMDDLKDDLKRADIEQKRIEQQERKETVEDDVEIDAGKFCELKGRKYGFTQHYYLASNTVVPSETKRRARMFRQKIERLLAVEDHSKAHRYKSGRLNTSKLWRLGIEETDVFYKKENESKDYCATLLIDVSGSMDSRTDTGTRYKDALKAASMIEEALRGLIPFNIILFTTDDYNVVHYTIKGFKGSKKNHCQSFLEEHPSAFEANNDAVSIAIAAEKLSKRPEQQKILFVISDGQPAHYGLSGSEGIVLTKQSVSEAKAKGVDVIGIAIGDESHLKYNAEAYEAIYGKSLVSVETNKIGSTLARLLETILK